MSRRLLEKLYDGVVLAAFLAGFPFRAFGDGNSKGCFQCGTRECEIGQLKYLNCGLYGNLSACREECLLLRSNTNLRIFDMDIPKIELLFVFIVILVIIHQRSVSIHK